MFFPAKEGKLRTEKRVDHSLQMQEIVKYLCGRPLSPNRIHSPTLNFISPSNTCALMLSNLPPKITSTEILQFLDKCYRVRHVDPQVPCWNLPFKADESISNSVNAIHLTDDKAVIVFTDKSCCLFVLYLDGLQYQPPPNNKFPKNPLDNHFIFTKYLSNYSETTP